MGRTLGLALAALGVALLGAGPTEHMLCFHQDGRVFLETYQEDCCDDGGCPTEDPSRCPDDQCRDLPLTLEGDGSLDVPSIDAAPAAIEAPLPVLSFDIADALELRAPVSRALDPPALDFLRAVVLRL